MMNKICLPFNRIQNFTDHFKEAVILTQILINNCLGSKPKKYNYFNDVFAPFSQRLDMTQGQYLSTV